VQVLNFVPHNHARKKLARQANLLSALLAAAVVVPLVMVVVIMGMAGDRVEATRLEVERLESGAVDGVARWEQLRRDRQALLERASKASQLITALPRSLLLAEIVGSLPPKTTLTKLCVNEKEVRIVEGAQASLSSRQADKKGAAAMVREYTETSVQLVGLAPTDIQAAELIAALTKSPYFDNVELSYSEDRKHNDHVLRRFEILFRLSDGAGRQAQKAQSGEGRL